MKRGRKKQPKSKNLLNLIDAEKFVKNLALKLSGGEVVGLSGDLGSGKTTFVKILAKELGVKQKVTSPTFSLANSFLGKLPKNRKNITLYHLDVYRLQHPNEFLQLGIHETLGKPDTIVCIEWAENVKNFLPPHTMFIKLENPNPIYE